MIRGAIWALVLPALTIGAGPVAAQGPLATQDPASAQPTLPKPMPDFTMPSSGSAKLTPKVARSPSATKHATRHHRYARVRLGPPLERPILAGVELVEPLPRPPQPPHVIVPVPAYPPEDFVTYFTAPPPPVVCRPTRHDRFKPDLGLVDETPVLCTADNP